MILVDSRYFVVGWVEPRNSESKSTASKLLIFILVFLVVELLNRSAIIWLSTDALLSSLSSPFSFSPDFFFLFLSTKMTEETFSLGKVIVSLESFEAQLFCFCRGSTERIPRTYSGAIVNSLFAIMTASVTESLCSCIFLLKYDLRPPPPTLYLVFSKE